MEFPVNRITIERCQFIRVFSEGRQGGAIFSSAKVAVVHSLFDRCSAETGGAMSASSEISVDYSTFTECNASESGAIDHRTTDDADFDVDQCLFLDDSADFFGAIYGSSTAFFVIASTNFTSPRARECVGCLDSQLGHLRMHFSILLGSGARAHNGGFCIREPDSMRIDSCLFAHCSHTSHEKAAAAVFLIYNNPYDSSILNSAFVDNQYSNSYTISVALGYPLILTGSCFTGPKEHEVCNCVIVGGAFGVEECAQLVALTGQAGYDPQSKKTPIARYKGRPSRSVGVAAFLGRPIAASVVIAFLLTTVQTFLRRLLKDRVKVPKALL
jgi:hypothetical protein